MAVVAADESALAAWRELHGGSGRGRVTPLQERDGRASFLLEVDGLRLVAKCGDVAVERLVYEEMLPLLDLPAPRYLGAVGPWLFVEHVGDVAFDPERPEHRAAAARWLARLHAGARALPLGETLPDRTASHYRGRLEEARRVLLAPLDNAMLGAKEGATLVAAAGRCDLLARRWADVASVAALTPSTLVHGDFHPSNVRVRGGDVLPFDWGSSGWGTPAEDVARADPAAYAAASPGLDEDDAGRLAELGRLFRTLALIAWNDRGLASPSAADVVRTKVRFYGEWLEESLRALRWTG